MPDGIAEFLDNISSGYGTVRTAIAAVSLVCVLVGVVVTLWVSKRPQVSLTSAAFADSGPVPDGVWHVRLLSGYSRSTSGKFQIVDGNLIFWADFAAHPYWAVKASRVGVYVPAVLGPPLGNVVLYAHRGELMCMVSKCFGADSLSEDPATGAELVQSLTADAESFTQALVAHGAKLLGRADSLV